MAFAYRLGNGSELLGPGNASSATDERIFGSEVVALISCLYVIVFIVGTLGNAAVATVICRNGDMRSSTNIFLVNLSLADLLVMFTSLPTALIELHSKPEVWTLGEVMCQVVPFVELLVPHTSVLTIVAITFERYYAVLRPLKAKIYRLSQGQTLLISVAVWCLSCFLTGPILWVAVYNPGTKFHDGSEAPSCHTPVQSFWQKFYFLAMLVLFYVIPFFIIAGLYVKIGRNLLKKKPEPTSTAWHQRSRRQVVCMLVVVVAVFFVCLLPYKCLTVWTMVAPFILISAVAHEDDISKLGSQKFHIILHFCRLTTYINSVANPVIYNIMSSRFRNEFKNVIVCWGRSTELSSQQDSHSYRTTSSDTGAKEKSKFRMYQKNELQQLPATF